MPKIYRESNISHVHRMGVERILHFSLQEAGASELRCLALDLGYRTLSALSCTDERPLLLKQEQFTMGEMSVVRPLLEAFPYYCPHETLFAHFYNGEINDTIVARCREHLQEAAVEGLWDQEMRPVRSVLSRARLKLRPFGIEVSSILTTGYMLMVASQQRQLHPVSA